MRKSKSTTKTTTPRRPADDGPDVLYDTETGCFDSYVDGRYLCSRTNNQDAWIEARRVHFENVEDAAIVTNDNAAEAAPVGDRRSNLRAALGFLCCAMDRGNNVVRADIAVLLNYVSDAPVSV